MEYLIPVAVAGFFLIFGGASALGRITATRYWSLRSNVGYLLHVSVMHLVLGALVGGFVALVIWSPNPITWGLGLIVTMAAMTTFVGWKWTRIVSVAWRRRHERMLKEAVGFRVFSVVSRLLPSSNTEAALSVDDLYEESPAERDELAGRLDTVYRFGRAVYDRLDTVAALGLGVAFTLPLGIAVVAQSPLILGAWVVLAIPLGFVSDVTQSWSPPAAAGTTEGKNVILCVIDALRRDRLSMYGYERRTSPFLDRVAASGLVFENCLAAGTSSGHSIPSLLSGTYASVHEYGGNLDVKLLSDEFREQGYLTGGISGNPHITAPRFGDRFDWFLYLDRGKSYLFLVQRLLVRALHLLGFRHVPVHYYIADVDFMHELAEGFLSDAAQRDRPFFLYLHYQDLHEPYLREFHPVASFASEHGAAIERGDWIRETGSDRRAEWYEAEVKNWGYDEKIRHTDRAIEDLYADLERLGLRRDTVVLFTSDHGELLGERGGWGHPDVPYNPLIEVPLIVDTPASDGETVSEVVSGVDLPSMVCDLAGIDPSSAFRYQWLRQFEPSNFPFDLPTEPYALVDYYSHAINLKGFDAPNGSTSVNEQRLALTTDWKLYQIDDEFEYYRYDDDFLDNPIASDELPDEPETELRRWLNETTRAIEDRRRDIQNEDPYGDVEDSRVQRQLEDLGYL